MAQCGVPPICCYSSQHTSPAGCSSPGAIMGLTQPTHQHDAMSNMSTTCKQLRTPMKIDVEARLDAEKCSRAVCSLLHNGTALTTDFWISNPCFALVSPTGVLAATGGKTSSGARRESKLHLPRQGGDPSGVHPIHTASVQLCMKMFS